MENKYLPLIESYLQTTIPIGDFSEKSVVESVKYSLLSPGKRLRPTLLLAFCDLCGGSVETALPFACAVEMVHSYSLIHDDLPCMDNDDLRRGRPSNHKVFGEDIALLAGDALQSLAYQTMLNDNVLTKAGLNGAKAAYILSEASGLLGMVGGQVIDIETEGKNPPIEIILEMYSKKTGKLIEAPCIMGCVLAGAGELQINAAKKYAESIGLAFQIVDDILDIISDTKTLGKAVGSDAQNEKSNYVTAFGIERSKQMVENLTQEAVDSLNAFENDTAFLKDLAFQLSKRLY